jgi:hypothetical protein
MENVQTLNLFSKGKECKTKEEEKKSIPFPCTGNNHIKVKI